MAKKTIIGIQEEEKELTITAYISRIGEYWQLKILGGNIPQEVKGVEQTVADEWYRVRLKNTENLNKTSPGWFRTWNKEGTAVDITSWAENFEVIKDHGRLTLTIKLRDDAVVERWYGEEW